MPYRLLDKFQQLFDGKVYNHRDSSQGDAVAVELYEDLYNVARSAKYVSRVSSGHSVVNRQNKRQGVVARRGDGSFGELIPNETPVTETGFNVKRGPIATIEIGIEVKILAKAMIKQIDRVISDLKGQVAHFKTNKGTPLTVGVVGVNRASQYTSVEGTRQFPTDGTAKYRHPSQEASEAITRLKTLAAPHFDEFLILEFEASNSGAFPFKWVDPVKANRDYGAILVRISNAY